MIQAKRLKRWDTIWLVAPSKAFNEEKRFELDGFVTYLESLWLKVKTSKNFYEKDKFWTSSWSPEQRASDINEMFWDDSISAIWTLQWWSLANQVLEHLDFNFIKNNPKIFIWKSDIDILLLSIYKKTGLITYHSCDSKIWSNKELDFQYTKEYLKHRLFEGWRMITSSNTQDWLTLTPWRAVWKSVWCNMTSILKLAWTEYFPDFTNKIFFIETYKVDAGTLLHQLTQLQMLGVFDAINWVVIWSNFWFDCVEFKAEEIITIFLKEYNLPILKINEFWHYQPHMFLPIWAEIELDATNKKIEIVENFLS